MKQWYVVYTHAKAESSVAGHLHRQGFDAYLPMCRKTLRHARRKTEVLRPLFPRYVFVALDVEADRWRAVNGTVGVCHLVCQGLRPLPLPDGLISDLRACEIEGGIVPLSRLAWFEKGARLQVLDGAFLGQSGIYERMTDAERGVLLFDLIGQQVEVSVPIHAVEAA